MKSHLRRSKLYEKMVCRMVCRRAVLRQLLTIHFQLVMCAVLRVHAAGIP